MQELKMKPHGRRLLIEVTGKMKLTGNSAIIQAETVNAPLTAKVIEIGDGEWQNGVFVPTAFKVDDNVLILEGQGGEVFSHGKSLLIVNEDMIIGSY